MNGYDDEFDDEYGYTRGSDGVFKDSSYEEQYDKGKDYPETGGLADLDMADEWLNANDDTNPSDKWSSQIDEEQEQVRDAQEAVYGDITAQEDMSIGSMTSYDKALIRFGHMPEGVRARAAQFLKSPTEQDVIFRGVLGTGKKDDMSLLQARESFGGVIGKGNIDRFVRDLEKGLDEVTRPSASTQDVRTVYSMLAKTAESYDLYGSADYASDRTDMQREDREAREFDARMKAIEFADKYVNPNLPAGPLRDRATMDNYNFIVKRAMEHKVTTRQVTDVTGRDLFVTEEMVPQNVRKVGGYTAADVIETRGMTASGIMPMPSEMPGLANLPQYNDYSPRQSLFNESVYGADVSSKLYAESKEEYRQMVSTFRQQTTTLSDEFHGNRERYIGQGISHETDWSLKQDFINEAMLFELEKESTDISHSQELENFVLEGRGKGSSTGGMYGEKGKSQSDLFVDARTQGLSSDDALLVATQGYQVEDLLGAQVSPLGTDETLMRLAKSNASDREKYQARIRAYPQPEQGTQAWLDSRAGEITGSATLAVNAYEKTIENRAIKLASGQSDSLSGYKTEAMAAGSAMESTVKKYLTEFLTGNVDSDLVRINKNTSIGETPDFRKKVAIDEAYRETLEDLPGFSVSPDGFVFNEKGESMGLAEFKYHEKDEKLDEIDPKYMRQMQMQMKVTGEEGVHFFRMSEESQEFAYDYVPANKELQDAIVRTNQKALNRAEEIKGGSMAVSHAQMKNAGKSEATVYKSKVQSKEAPATVFSGPASSQARVQSWVGGGKGMTQAGQMADYEAMFDALEDADLAAMNEEAANAALEKANADKEAARASRDFSNSVSAAGKAAGNLIGIFAGLGKEGLDTGMTDVRLAAKAGMSADETRNMRFALEAQGGLSSQESGQVIMQAGKLAATFNDPTQGVGAYTTMESSLQAAKLGSLGSYESMRSKSPAEMLSYHQDRMNAFTDPEKRATYGAITGMSNLAISAGANEQLTGSALLTIKEGIDEKGLRTSQEGYMDVDQWMQKKKEQGAVMTGGEVIRAGEGLSTAVAVGKNTAALMALTGAVLANTVAQGGGSVGSKGLLKKSLMLGPAAVVLAPAAAIISGVGQTLENAEMRESMTQYTDEDRDKIEAETLAFQNANPEMQNPEYWKNLNQIGNVKSTTKTADDSITSNVTVNVEVAPAEVVTKVDNNGTIEMYTEEQDSGQH